MLKFLGARFKDQMRGVVISLLATAIVVPLACVLIFIPLWFANQPGASIWVLIVPASLFLLILLGGGWGAVGWTFYRRKRWLDSLFTPWGLTGSRYMISGRQYQGTRTMIERPRTLIERPAQGREIIARFYRGPTLDLYVGTPLQTRLGIAEKSGTSLTLAGMVGREPLPLDDPDLDGLSIFALDEEWAHSLLADPEAKMLLLRLMRAGESWVLMPQLFLQPGMFHLRLYRNKNLFKYGIEPEEAQAWLDDLLALARIAEGLPAPQVTAEESGAERMVRSGRTFSITLIIIALLVGVPTCALAIVAAVVFVIAIR
ncbi:MAG: hypothetical protein B6I35_03400 [Anaerolineaceae bacterium 4572_32.2]|nr:MAG: hypothetical protein B6I35_03400 [Anaerolineaceae bacterium 4572_32.2]